MLDGIKEACDDVGMRANVVHFILEFIESCHASLYRVMRWTTKDMFSGLVFLLAQGAEWQRRLFCDHQPGVCGCSAEYKLKACCALLPRQASMKASQSSPVYQMGRVLKAEFDFYVRSCLVCVDFILYVLVNPPHVSRALEVDLGTCLRH